MAAPFPPVYTSRVRALVIQHDHLCLPGFVGERLSERGFEIVVHEVVAEEHHHAPAVRSDFPDPTDFDVIVAMGAPWSAYEDSVQSWLLPELQLLRDADAARVPVLGVCFGGQLLAAAHGGSVERAERPELGWFEIDSDDGVLVPGGLWFEWHYDRWRLPPGAVEVSRNASTSQAFVLGRNLAVQFHPEIDETILAGWLAGEGDGEARQAGVDPAALLAETRQQSLHSRPRAHRLVDAFLDHVATR